MKGNEIVVLITAGSEEEATKISRSIVQQELVACVNILPQIRSIFQWEGEVKEEQEWLLIAKTKSRVFQQLVIVVKALHSYSVPEVIALPIQDGLSEYLNWIGDVVKQK